jgi:hypothetical protein
MTTLLHLNGRLFDAMERRRDGPAARKFIATVITSGFFVALLVIELNRLGWLPPSMSGLPTNHFYAFDVAFTLFLIVEVVELVFGLATSVANTLGKQFEIFSLILLRQSFKELVYFEEPISWSLEDDTARQAVQFIVSDAVGALLVFIIIGVYYKLQRHQPITETEAEQRRFVLTKKLLANGLLLIFVGLGVYTGLMFFLEGMTIPVFNVFYTVLIFSDVLIVLISIRYGFDYHVVFRNFGFAAATVMIRLALAAPHYVDAALGIGAALFAVGLTLAYNYVTPAVEQSQRLNVEQKSTDRAVESVAGEEEAPTL